MSTPLSDAIRTSREAAKLTRAQLADRADLSEAYIEALECGRRDAPTLPVLTRLADALGWDAARRASVLAAPPSTARKE